MKLASFDNPTEYYQRVESYLLQNEAIHCLLIGLSNALCSSQKNNANFPYLVTVEHDGIIAATAIRTSPLRRLVLSKSTDLKAINLITENVVALPNKSLPGVIGLKSEATTFALTWQSLTGQTYELAFAMRIHQLETAQSVTKTSGSFRMATENDRSLLTNWIQAFEEEALGDSEPKSDCQSWFEKNLQQKSLFIWQDKVPVSMAAFGGATPNGVKINAVYTPPEFRGIGYATSCVAALSQQLLNQGYKYCFLFTDLANPTSNHIYQKIGYQPVCEISNYNFKYS
ncbi:GNAT family N-acetyltransferase [Pleurocapsa sp. PCC 7319]|uniref:GNAT family N-acetyltransferase n=1 Tax=Pleurocapsa sp. PCC 7319 TaxID=118161 RepID=UPI0003457817|nr:GNAT family N-acetyltransferase [Pleurocapsa sp. PCC 7319]